MVDIFEAIGICDVGDIRCRRISTYFGFSVPLIDWGRLSGWPVWGWGVLPGDCDGVGQLCGVVFGCNCYRDVHRVAGKWDVQ